MHGTPEKSWFNEDLVHKAVINWVGFRIDTSIRSSIAWTGHYLFQGTGITAVLVMRSFVSLSASIHQDVNHAAMMTGRSQSALRRQ